MTSKIKYLLVAYLLLSCNTQQKLSFANAEPETDIVNEEFLQDDGNIAVATKPRILKLQYFQKIAKLSL